MGRRIQRPLRQRIARVLSRRAHDLGISNVQLAKRTGLGETTIRRTFTGESCQIETVERIARALRIDLVQELGSR